MLPVVPPLRATPPAQDQLPPGTCAQPRVSTRFRAGLLLQPCFSPEKTAPAPRAAAGCQACKSASRQQFAQNLLGVLISSLSPERHSACKAGESYLQLWTRRGEAAFVPAWKQPSQGGVIVTAVQPTGVWRGFKLLRDLLEGQHPAFGREPGLSGEKAPEHSPPTPQRILGRKGIS